MKVKQALELVAPEYKQLLTELLIRENMSTEMPAGAAMALLVRKNLTKEELMAAVSLGGVGNRDRYAPKLGFEERCEVLALYRKGFSRETIARAYNINRRTVTHIHNIASSHYHNVREEEKRLGTENFKAKYITHDVAQRVAEFAVEEQEEKGNNKYANRLAGTHLVQGPMCNYKHRVIIDWVEAGVQNIEKSGWYYRDLDGDMPNAWFTVGDGENLKTSMAAYKAMLGDITDRIE
jgi:hypothetical protein